MEKERERGRSESESRAPVVESIRKGEKAKRARGSASGVSVGDGRKGPRSSSALARLTGAFFDARESQKKKRAQCVPVRPQPLSLSTLLSLWLFVLPVDSQTDRHGL